MPTSHNFVQSLSQLLADTYTLYLKTQNYHWNVTGPQFVQLHELFEKQYTDLAAAVDLLAERIRALGAPAPGSFKAFSKLTSLSEAEDTPLPALEMIGNLASDNRKLLATAKAALAVAQEGGDEATADIIIERLQAHDKAVWMLDALGK